VGTGMSHIGFRCIRRPSSNIPEETKP